jgi:hypothetical protein
VRHSGAAGRSPVVAFGATFQAKSCSQPAFPSRFSMMPSGGLRLDRDHFGRGDLVSVVRRVYPGWRCLRKRAMQQSDFSRRRWAGRPTPQMR